MFSYVSRSFSQLQWSNRFSCLRYLHVSLAPGQEVSPETWTLFCSVLNLSSITHFALQSNAYESLITALGYSSDESASSSAPPILPELHTLSFDHIYARTATLLCDLVSKCHTAGWPLRSLQLPMEIFHESLQGLCWLIVSSSSTR